SKALDEVRRGEYRRLSGKDRSYIKGQRYTLLSRRKNLSLDGRRALKTLFKANRRLNTAYVLKEAFGQLWDYRTERGARAFFERWKDSLKWQRLKPYRVAVSKAASKAIFLPTDIFRSPKSEGRASPLTVNCIRRLLASA
ncbi:MAG: transposase, partial [Myxococcales bacterium]|nr:transposase [Myxococcales bacterium]